MDYTTNITYLMLEGHVDLDHYRYLYFLITLTIIIMIICFNTVIIFVIYKNKCLHEPMYIFTAALLCNGLFGSTALYPKLLTDLLSEKQMISFGACLFQAFCLYTYGGSEFMLLSAMAYDRYVSICNPLQYANLLKMSTVRKLIFLAWFLPCCEVGIAIMLTSRLQLCKYKMNRLYCDNYSVAKLNCREAFVSNLYGLIMFSFVVFPQVIFIIYSYIRILSVCLKNSKHFRKKALQTCLPHLLSLIVFSVNTSFEIINNRLESGEIPHFMTMIMSVMPFITTPLINPIIYGLKLQEIFNNIKRLISWG